MQKQKMAMIARADAVVEAEDVGSNELTEVPWAALALIFGCSYFMRNTFFLHVLACYSTNLTIATASMANTQPMETHQVLAK